MSRSLVEVTRWEASVDLAESKVELSANARSLEVREGGARVKPLTRMDVSGRPCQRNDRFDP